MRLTTSRVIAVALALPVLAGIGIAVAPSAMAAASPASITAAEVNTGVDVCDNSAHTKIVVSGTSTVVTSVTANVGDTLTLMNYCNWPGPLDLDFIPNAGATVTVSRMQTGSMTLIAGVTSIQVKNTNNNAILKTITVVLSGGGSGGSGDASGPAPWLQSFARASAAAACPAGYGASWAQWPNGGKGGFVCNRTLVFDGSAYNWITG